MKLSVKITILSLIFALGLYMGVGTIWLMRGWGIAVKVLLYCAGGAGCAAGVLFFVLKKDALLKTVFVLMACAAVVYTSVVILNFTARLYELENDGEKISELTNIIKGANGWAMAVYVLIQIMQVVFLPIPALVCYIPGVIIWGPLKATLLASAGVLAGSVICYFMGRLFGRKVVEWIAGKENTAKYADIIGKRGKPLFVIMQVLPFFPDDILCLVAGMTKMNFAFFSVVMVIVRPAIVAAYCYFGNGSVIPFSGWGIAVWIAIILVCVALAAVSLVFRDKIENGLKKLFRRKNKDGE